VVTGVQTCALPISYLMDSYKQLNRDLQKKVR
jgi:hypothetical protein